MYVAAVFMTLLLQSLRMLGYFLLYPLIHKQFSRYVKYNCYLPRNGTLNTKNLFVFTQTKVRYFGGQNHYYQKQILSSIMLLNK